MLTVGISSYRIAISDIIQAGLERRSLAAVRGVDKNLFHHLRSLGDDITSLYGTVINEHNTRKAPLQFRKERKQLLIRIERRDQNNGVPTSFRKFSICWSFFHCSRRSISLR